MPRKLVFISHYHAESPIAERLQSYLHARFGEDLEVFRSSDDQSIPTGRPQRPEIMEALASARVYVLLLSNFSAQRPWVNFEAGFAECRRLKKGADVFAILIRGARADDIPSPLRDLQLRPIKLSVLQEIVEAVARVTGRTPGPDGRADCIEEFKAAETTMGDWGLHIHPFRHGSGASALGFELTYAGPRPIRLTKIWAEVEAALVNDPRWPIGRTGVEGHLHNNKIQDAAGNWVWRRELIANPNPPARNSLEPLPPTLNTLQRPLILKQMEFAYLEFGANPGSMIHYGVETEEGVFGPYALRVEQVEIRQL